MTLEIVWGEVLIGTECREAFALSIEADGNPCLLIRTKTLFQRSIGELALLLQESAQSVMNNRTKLRRVGGRAMHYLPL